MPQPPTDTHRAPASLDEAYGRAQGSARKAMSAARQANKDLAIFRDELKKRGIQIGVHTANEEDSK